MANLGVHALDLLIGVQRQAQFREALGGKSGGAGSRVQAAMRLIYGGREKPQ
jgi:hypothetical protein